MGRIVAILTSPASGSPVGDHPAVEVLAGRGIVGDRYATGQGFYSGMAEWDAQVTLIEREPFDAPGGEGLEPMDLRRNLVTLGVDLTSLVGRRFRIGERVVLYGRKPWPPCMHIVQTSGKVAIFKHLGRRCGIGADVLEGGEIRVGDAIVVENE
ncbi:MOSC domain-containing protein [Paludisphaera rhizosphaerae]|uniref:MOSC domain-containing protein n=1 Tax=Paludisphaera rhizosphaerae TaxID=2711216 RepID=UPI0013ED072E|nr:MOSC domain-containing protein [Paludisphaera rhizosphaerae]